MCLGFNFFFFLILILVALGLCCCARAFSNGGEQGLLFVAGRGLLIAVDVFCCRAQLPDAWASVAAA